MTPCPRGAGPATLEVERCVVDDKGRATRIVRVGDERWVVKTGPVAELQTGHDLLKLALCADSRGVLPVLTASGWLMAKAKANTLVVLDVDLHDAGPKGSSAFVATRYVEGATLSDVEVSPDQRLRVLGQVAHALDLIHAAGFAHGDVKRENVIVDDGGRATLIDLSLATVAGRRAITGATPRLLASTDPDLGSARQRDLLALGVLIAELYDSPLRDDPAPAETLREAPERAGPLAAICAALISPSPAARPSARWAASELLPESELPEANAAWVRFSYRACLGAGNPTDMSPAQRHGWLVSLVGPPAAVWPVPPAQSDTDFAHHLESLARRIAPREWTLADLRQRQSDALPSAPPDATVDTPDGLLRLAVRLTDGHATEGDLRLIETSAVDLPPALIVAAIRALRLRGDVGRALALCTRAGTKNNETVEVLRRAGYQQRAAELAEKLIALGHPDAAAYLARIRFDQGSHTEAWQLTDASFHPRALEVRALIANAAGNRDEAISLAKQGLSVSRAPEHRARLNGTLAYVLKTEDACEALRRFELAILHASHVGAAVEEATYRVGAAAVAFDLGDFRQATDQAERSVIMWDHALNGDPRSTRAWLTLAAVYGAVGARSLALNAIEAVMDRAAQADDQPALALALCLRCDLEEPGATVAQELLCSYLATHALASGGKAIPLDICSRAIEHLDDFDPPPLPTDPNDDARLRWLRARCVRALSTAGEEPGAAALLHAVDAALLGAATLHTKLISLHAAQKLALRTKDERHARQYQAQRIRLRNQLQLPPALVPFEQACDWALDDEQLGGLDGAQAVDLRKLVGLLAERDDVEGLLRRILDVLLLWTGAQRALLLQVVGGELQITAARNLKREDLSQDQLQVSKTLATKALASESPVVAFDALADLGDTHASVHQLNLRSVLVLPLLSGSKPIGVVYLDDRGRAGVFGKREVGLGELVAPVAALAIEDALLRAELRETAAALETERNQLENRLAHASSTLDAVEQQLRASGPEPGRGGYETIIGSSDTMRRLVAMVDRVAKSNLCALILGESGTGKELVARAIHQNSPRRRGPFVAENCGALPETLLESALFGHTKGAFTGATSTRIGLFEGASGGTLFLDEVGEMSLALQAKLLRVLEDGAIRPVGSNQVRIVDVRIVAATHRDLASRVEEGTFREDLYYRLNVIPIHVPPLRERTQDVADLAIHFLKLYSDGAALPRLSPQAVAYLAAQKWPGNVRQLQNEVRRALVLSDGSELLPEHFSGRLESDRHAAPAKHDLRGHVDALERRMLAAALHDFSGNRTKAAEALGVSRYGLLKKLKRLGLDTKPPQ